MGGERPQMVTVDDTAIEHLVQFCQERQYSRLIMVADNRTYAAQGEAVVRALRAQDFDLKTVIFTDEEVVADADHIFQVMLAADGEPRIYIAVGSGTITDITRFSSHRTHTSFISVPTAPSVDGFASIGAPLIIGGVKETVICHAPIAIFADVNTLASAPHDLVAAGFADMLGKFTSIADWRIGRLLWNEPYDEEIAVRTLAAVQRCVDRVDEIGAATPVGVQALLEELIESGYCMLDFGSSRPASGAEHHYSHYWEMRLLREGRPAILHGAKVGVATVLVAELYAQLRSLTAEDVARLLQASKLPPRDAEFESIEATYGAQTANIIAAHRAFLNMPPAEFAALKLRIIDSWAEIQQIAAQVPPPAAIADWLRRAGGPVDVGQLGLSDEEKCMAEQYGHYLRDRFTVRKLMRVLGL